MLMKANTDRIDLTIDIWCHRQSCRRGVAECRQPSIPALFVSLLAFSLFPTKQLTLNDTQLAFKESMQICDSRLTIKCHLIVRFGTQARIHWHSKAINLFQTLFRAIDSLVCRLWLQLQCNAHLFWRPKSSPIIDRWLTYDDRRARQRHRRRQHWRHWSVVTHYHIIINI